MNLGVLISGRGSNLGAVLSGIAAGLLPARISLVISNKPEAKGLERAREAGVPTRVIKHGDYPDRAAFDAALVAALREASVDLVVLAGFMRLLTPTFLEAFPSRVVNIHPALLPAFPGVDAQAQALAYGARVTGCTVHFVDAGTDTGPVIAQTVVPILDGDDRERLAARILPHEHELLVRALSWIAHGKVEVIPPAAPGARATVRVRGERTFFGLVEAEAPR
ncbi:MAG: phosphoribosylglycinamide formyltransferase [Minicystis sp.]